VLLLSNLYLYCRINPGLPIYLGLRGRPPDGTFRGFAVMTTAESRGRQDAVQPERDWNLRNAEGDQMPLNRSGIGTRGTPKAARCRPTGAGLEPAKRRGRPDAAQPERDWNPRNAEGGVPYVQDSQGTPPSVFRGFLVGNQCGLRPQVWSVECGVWSY